MVRRAIPIITENNEMATTVETGFSNVDAGRDARDLVEYLGFAAQFASRAVQPLCDEG
jgi:hypothetical protein